MAGPPLLDTLHAMGLDETTAAAAMAAYRERYSAVGYLENPGVRRHRVVADRSHGGGSADGCGHLQEPGDGRQDSRTLRLAHHFEVIAGASDDGSRRNKSDVIGHA